MTDDIDIAADIRVQLNAVIPVLRAAKEVTPQRNPFRKVDQLLGEAIAAAVEARKLCQKV